MRNAILWAVLALILVLVNMQIIGKERVLANGEIMLLSLAPLDPRSLLQGDYMALRYSLTNRIGRYQNTDESADWQVVVTLDQHRVASFVRLHDETRSLSPTERLLAYRKRGSSVRIAGDAYFFQEGQARTYANARFGELRVDQDGHSVLVGLRDGNYQLLGAEPR